MHNPLRSEADAFRWLVVIGIGAASVIALTLLTRPLVGAIWALVLIAGGAVVGYRISRGSERPPLRTTRGGDGRRRLLVIANETVGGKRLLEEIGIRGGGGDCEILVVTPALTGSRAAHWSSDIDEAIVLARQRMELSVLEIKERLGMRAKGEIGDSDPILALEDALRAFPADEIVISTHPPHTSRWLERGVVERAREQVEVPITHVVVDVEAEREPAGQVGDSSR